MPSEGTVQPVGFSVKHEQLLKVDDELIREKFLEIFAGHYDERLVSAIGSLFSDGVLWEETSDEKYMKRMLQTVEELQPTDLILISSAFSNMVNLHNLSEEAVNAEHEKYARMGEADQHYRTTSTAIEKLRNRGVSKEDIYKTICATQVELVLTAHPTQALRQSVLKKFAAIKKLLFRYSEGVYQGHMGPIEKFELLKELSGLVQAAWRTDEIRRQQPTPLQEMRSGLSYFQETIFDLLPRFHRRIDSVLQYHGMDPLPVNHSCFKFGSWMGGDRDGNPNVTAQTTREVVLTSMVEGCNLYQRGVDACLFHYSMWRMDDDSPMARLVDEILRRQDEVDVATVSKERKRRNYTCFLSPSTRREPYRVVLGSIRDKLWKTRTLLYQCLEHDNYNVMEHLQQNGGYYASEQLLLDLSVMHDSLVQTGDIHVAGGPLQDLIRQVKAFGLSVMRLDIRQESTRHTEVLTELCHHLGIGDFDTWTTEEQCAWLQKELEGKRPLLPPDFKFKPAAQEVVDTMYTLSQLPPETLGAYVISMSRTAADVLAVALLQKECGVRPALRVVPLFETRNDLRNAPDAMRQLFKQQWYLQRNNFQQECMIGYSDSGKDASRLAAAWALYEVQEKLVAVAREYNVHLTLFHGRGGTVGRGGGPTHMAIRSQPPGTMEGNLRVTIQGEVIEQQLGEPIVGFRTLDLYLSAVLEFQLDRAVTPVPEWRSVVAQMADKSCQAYRAIVKEHPTFYQLFTQVTPVDELSRVNIGSRPAKRKKTASIETLRAIPWIFAWTQTRFHLPVWLGLGEALEEQIEKGQLALVQQMYREWPFLKVTLDMVEMVFAKADVRVFQLYMDQLLDPTHRPLAEQLLDIFRRTQTCLLKVLNYGELLGGSNESKAIGTRAVLLEKLRLRSPYITPLNVMQVVALRQLRKVESNPSEQEPDFEPSDREALALLGGSPKAGRKLPQALSDTLVITIKGIATGMQNTG